MNRPNAPSTPPVPGARPDDNSVAGEEDPGASLGEPPRPAQAQPPRPAVPTRPTAD
ncbi:hypothetical protein ACG02S_21455 [Roseateles sp. DC23W]|uniref:Uncharacterized protein n=1 Tax=Pelomonas dachongensis TaxID=3299029 RepID=A0ABW7EW63_9BURK